MKNGQPKSEEEMQQWLEENQRKMRAMLKEYVDEHPEHAEAYAHFKSMSKEQWDATGLLFQKALSTWPSVSYEGPILVQNVWTFCREQMQEGQREGLRAIKEHERELAALIGARWAWPR